jgi:hypothetical protein
LGLCFCGGVRFGGGGLRATVLRWGGGGGSVHHICEGGVRGNGGSTKHTCEPSPNIVTFRPRSSWFMKIPTALRNWSAMFCKEGGGEVLQEGQPSVCAAEGQTVQEERCRERGHKVPSPQSALT